MVLSLKFFTIWKYSKTMEIHSLRSPKASESQSSCHRQLPLRALSTPHLLLLSSGDPENNVSGFQIDDIGCVLIAVISPKFNNSHKTAAHFRYFELSVFCMQTGNSCQANLFDKGRNLSRPAEQCLRAGDSRKADPG